MRTKQMQDFTRKLNALLVEFNAELFYTIDDDGLHATIGNETVQLGFIPSAPGQLKENDQ